MCQEVVLGGGVEGCSSDELKEEHIDILRAGSSKFRANIIDCCDVGHSFVPPPCVLEKFPLSVVDVCVNRGSIGCFGFFLVVVVLVASGVPERSWVFSSCSFITCVICCCIRVSIDSICAAVALLLFGFFILLFEGDSLLLSGVSGFTDGRRAGGVSVDLTSVRSVVLIYVSW